MPINRWLLSPRLRKIVDSSDRPPNWIYALIRKRREQAARWRPPGSPFNLGQKQVLLPRFKVALLRTPHLGAQHAQFEVPLHFSKLDIRDYLYHVYNVRVHAIRSYVQHKNIQPVERGSNKDIPGKRKTYRPQFTKRMICELDQPFVWPDRPKNLEPWGHKRYVAQQKVVENAFKGKNNSVEEVKREYATAAKRILQGKQQWFGASGVPTDPLRGLNTRELPIRTR